MPTREELQNKYSTILSGGNNARLRASVRGVIDRSPDQSAEVINLSQRTGLPAPLVERNRDSVARRSKVDRYSNLLKTNPRLGAFMSEPENASVAHDDIENLSGLEWVFKAFRGAHREQWETIELGRLRSQQLSGVLSEQQQSRVEALSEQQRGGEFGAEGWWENVVVETGRLLPTMEAALGGGVEKAALYGGGFAGAALIAGQAGPQVLAPEELITVPGAALMGMGFGMAAGAAEEVYNLEAGLAYDEFLQMEGAGGESIDDGVARAAASMVGAVNAGLELVGFGAVARTIPGVNRLKSSIGRTAVKEALKQPTFRNALMRFAGSYAGAMGTEVTTEILQEASTILGGELAGQLSAGEFQSLSPEEMGTRLAEIAVKTTQGMTVLAGVGPSVQLASDARNAQRARQNQQVFQALGEHAENSKLRQRLPEKFRQYVERLKEGGDIDAVRVPVEAFDEYFQSEGLNPRDVYQEVIGNPNGYDEAQAAGTDISIPIDRYAAQLAGTRHHEALMPNLRLRPDDMTMREAEAWQAQSEQILEELSAGLEPATESSRVVYDDVMGQLLQTGMEQGAAEQNAQLMASVFDTLAQRTGTTAEALYERYGLRIQREMPEVLRNLQKIDLNIDPLIDQLRSGQVPSDREIYGESLSEFLRERGGLQDQGGELAARDVQKSIRGLVKPEGMTFDEAAELAQESGYITERSEQSLLDAIGREISGEGAFRPDAANQQLLDLRMALDDLDNYLGQQGVDLQSVGNEDIRQLLQGTVFDQRFDETRRGSIQFGRDRQFNINLLKSADLSTVLHESGHFYLEILGDLAEEDGSPAQVTQDYSAILKWLGVESRQAIGTEQHEQFARGFEAYLMEGKAPSIELQTAFARFRAWLVSLYRQLKALNVTLTDEVRGVFDRMVATDDAIETAEQSQNYVALFTDAEAAGMSPEQWNAYRRVAQDARIEAEDKLSRQLMDVMRREQLKWWREQKDRVRGEVSGEIHRMPVYQALSFLSRGTNPDGSAVEGVTPVKLSKAILMEEYGLPQEFLNKLPGHGPRSIYTTKEGVHPDFVAPMFGYSSGRAMIEALASARPMRELIAAETDARMSEQYPDPLTDGSLADRAINAVHSDKRAELLSAELRALRRKRAEVQPFVRAAERQAARERRESREANRASIPRGDDLRVIKAAAERIIGQKVIRDIQPHSYRVAEAKAARKAFDAAGRGDFETAYFEKRKEILNHELYRSATKGMERAEKARTYFKKFGKKRTRERIGKAGGEYLENIDALLADFSLGRISGAAIDRAKAKRHILDQIAAGEIVADQETIRALEQEAVKNWRELSLDTFVGLQDTIRQIEHEARMLAEAIVNGERVALNEVATEIGTAIRESGKESPLERGQPSQAETRKETPRSMESAWLRPGNTARILDGREWGPTTRYLVSMLRQATVNRLLPWLHADYESFNALYDKHYSNKELRQFHDKDFFEGLSRSDVISMALYRGNATSWRALIEGVDRKQADAAVYPQAFVERAMSRLDSRDYAFVEDLWKHFNSYWTEFAAAEKRRRGIAPEKIEATPYTVVTSDGATLTVSGGYVPNSYDSRYDSSKRVEDIDFFQKMQTGSIVTASTRAGASHERVGSGKRVLALGLERMQRSHQEVIRDVAIGDEVNFVRRILTSDEVVSAARDTGQMEKIKALDTWLRDSATGEVPATHGIEKWLRMFRTNFIASKIGISLTTTFLQPTGAFPSMAILGRQAFGRGLGRYMSDPKRWHDWMMEKSAFMRARYQLDTVNKDIQDASAAVGIGSSALPTTFHRWHQNAKSWMFAPIKAFQLPVDSATFLGAYWKGEQMGLTGDDLVAYADARVEEAQTSGLFVDRSNFERGSIGNVKQSQFLRMWSTLIGYMLAQTNNMYERGVQFKRRPTLKNAITAGVFFGQVYILQTLVEAFIRGQWPDDDDDESFAWWTTKRAAENVVSGVPFLREYQSFGYGAGGDTPITSWLSDVYKAQEQLAQGEIDEPLTKNVINAIGGITGAPSTQINRAVDAHFAEREGENVEFYEYLTGHRE